MLQVLAGVYAVCAFAGLLLLGQGAVWLISFGRHERNPVYRAVRFLTSPVTRLVRLFTPARIADRHLPLVAFLLLFWVWVLVFDGIRLMPRAGG